MLYNPFSIQRHLHPRAAGLITYGGGGGEDVGALLKGGGEEVLFKGGPATDTGGPVTGTPAEMGVDVEAVASQGIRVLQYGSAASGTATYKVQYPDGTLSESFTDRASAQAKVDVDTKTAADKAAADAKAAADKAAADTEAARVAAAVEQKRVNAENASALQAKQLADPASVTTKADVATIDPNATGLEVATSTGQLDTPAPVVDKPDAFEAGKVAGVTASSAVSGITDPLDSVQGTVSPDSLASAVTADPTEMASLDLAPAQIAQSQQVAPVPPRVIEQGEMISGSAVDMAAVSAAVEFQAAQATPSAQATVKGQMAELMTEFEGTEPPAWAAGALRNATAQMAARGLGASSMAGQALVQAAMESALPIAMQDAKTFATFEGQNLSNRQQTAMFGAQQRAQFLGMQFTQEFQTRVTNSARVADIANINFTAEQQVALENARMAQTVDLSNLNAVNAKIMADAAAMSQMELTNLNNRQQSAMQNAQAFLGMNMQNLSNAQQTRMFKAQSNIQAIFGDQAAINAAGQFNASSDNQTNQFFANMDQQVQQFNAGMEVQRDQFNAQNALVVAQANAQWRQNVQTVKTAAQNESNRDAALAANQMTQSTLENVWQRERDVMDYAFRQSEAAEDRATSVFLADKQGDIAEAAANSANAQSDKEGKGYIFSRLLLG